LFYLILISVFPYRKKVIETNLRNSFPELSRAEIRTLRNKFYRHFADLVIEGIKNLSISKSELAKRFVLKNPEIIDKIIEKNQSVMLISGHYGNWEWAAITLPFQSSLSPQGVYLPIKDPVFNSAMIRSRSRFGIDLLLASDMQNEMLKRKDVLSITGFIADQSPSDPSRGLWLEFLNQETSVARGTEKYARMYHMAVVFGKIRKVRRGYYTLEYRLICENAAETTEGEITRAHTKELEDLIQEEPGLWLWSHKRWKHKKTKS
jgi:KDO2-lipid IV(A) lauroyltransferase